MIIPIDDLKYADVLAAIYNSANALFPEEQRRDADGMVFYRQLQEDRNFLFVDEGEPCGFTSCRRCGDCLELTSLYVKRERQDAGVGRQLLACFEGQADGASLLIVKVLRQAHWALAFYQKHGYGPLSDEARRLLEGQGVTEKAWERILCKTVSAVPVNQTPQSSPPLSHM